MLARTMIPRRWKSQMDEAHAPFPTTNWSLVRRAADDRDSLNELLQRYWPALQAYLIRRGVAAADAADLVQEFSLNVILRRGLLDNVRQGTGRFRTLLLRALSNLKIDHFRRQKRQRSLTTDIEPEEFDAVPAATLPPSDAPDEAADAFDWEWARLVLARTLERLEGECHRKNQPMVWQVFQNRVVGPAYTGQPPTPYSEWLRQARLDSEKQAGNALVTAKRKFKALLREVVADYVVDPRETDDEIANLRQTVARIGPKFGGETWERLFAVDPSLGVETSDPEGAMSELLATPLSSLIADFPRVWEETLRPEGATLEHVVTVEDLFCHPQPPLDLLRIVKRVAQRQVAEEPGGLPSRIAEGLYFGVIATALLRHRRNITSRSDRILEVGIGSMLERTWIAGPLRNVLQSVRNELAERPSL